MKQKGRCHRWQRPFLMQAVRRRCRLANLCAQRHAEIPVGIAGDLVTLAVPDIQQGIALVGDIACMQGQPIKIVSSAYAKAGIPDAIAVNRPALAQVGELGPGV